MTYNTAAVIFIQIALSLRQHLLQRLSRQRQERSKIRSKINSSCNLRCARSLFTPVHASWAERITEIYHLRLQQSFEGINFYAAIETNRPVRSQEPKLSSTVWGPASNLRMISQVVLITCLARVLMICLNQGEKIECGAFTWRTNSKRCSNHEFS